MASGCRRRPLPTASMTTNKHRLIQMQQLVALTKLLRSFNRSHNRAENFLKFDGMSDVHVCEFQNAIYREYIATYKALWPMAPPRNPP